MLGALGVLGVLGLLAPVPVAGSPGAVAGPLPLAKSSHAALLSLLTLGKETPPVGLVVVPVGLVVGLVVVPVVGLVVGLVVVPVGLVVGLVVVPPVVLLPPVE